MLVSAFDFELPENLIALRPSFPRDSARVLRVIPGKSPVCSDHRFEELGELLDPGDMLVLNDTRVIPARLSGERLRWQSRARFSVNLVSHVSGSTWTALARPLRKIRPSDDLLFHRPNDPNPTSPLVARADHVDESGLLTLTFATPEAEVMSYLSEFGSVPLPPYIEGRRSTDSADRTDYQTVFASSPGAVAAPTAGLHFTDKLLDSLRSNGFPVVHLTLHVSAGTFLPVTGRTVRDHVMHAERGILSSEIAEKINAHRRAGGKVVACGTTSLRLLESACDTNGELRAFDGLTDLFIFPGQPIRVVDRLITNFHLPRSTLFILVAAFIGADLAREVYVRAIENQYRFYSYGDACLLDRRPGQAESGE